MQNLCQNVLSGRDVAVAALLVLININRLTKDEQKRMRRTDGYRYNHYNESSCSFIQLVVHNSYHRRAGAH